MRLLVTGGAGFIGSEVVLQAVLKRGHEVIVVDSLTYAGNVRSLVEIADHEAFQFEHVDVCGPESIRRVFAQHRPRSVIHLAAESHVDRSIDGAGDFVRTNVAGTQVLLDAALEHWQTLDGKEKESFRFVHVSTDEVYGGLEPDGAAFTERTPYAPSSPYAATKAASDHLVQAWHRTFGFPAVITNCSNNYGPRQFPEKLIPHFILRALRGRALPLYGDGRQVRDWLFVGDHASALFAVLEGGRPGETYNIGGDSERQNVDVARTICQALDSLAPERRRNGLRRYQELITYVRDRPGHDRRYAIDASKLRRDLGWSPAESCETGLRRTVAWYLDNEDWWRGVVSGEYRLQRLGEVGAVR